MNTIHIDQDLDSYSDYKKVMIAKNLEKLSSLRIQFDNRADGVCLCSHSLTSRTQTAPPTVWQLSSIKKTSKSMRSMSLNVWKQAGLTTQLRARRISVVFISNVFKNISKFGCEIKNIVLLMWMERLTRLLKYRNADKNHRKNSSNNNKQASDTRIRIITCIQQTDRQTDTYMHTN